MHAKAKCHGTYWRYVQFSDFYRYISTTWVMTTQSILLGIQHVPCNMHTVLSPPPNGEGNAFICLFVCLFLIKFPGCRTWHKIQLVGMCVCLCVCVRVCVCVCVRVCKRGVHCFSFWSDCFPLIRHGAKEVCALGVLLVIFGLVVVIFLMIIGIDHGALLAGVLEWLTKHYNMTVWILARKEINFSMAAGLIRLHMPGVK